MRACSPAARPAAPSRPATAARRRDTPTDPREEPAVVRTGDLWRVVVEANDCDLHLVIHLPSARARDRVDLATPVRVRLTGYGFWDGAQWCRQDGVRGCGHATDAVATIWELHRVWRVEPVETASPSRPTGPGAPAATPEPSTDAHAGRVVCGDGWTSACACGHPPGMGCCRGHHGECGVCRGSR